ncbi:hypothetical protein KC866_00600 [Patescibacteria group bacterium]|nr:hypothetical protein [Patescibacteria group bacterium]
MKRIGHGWQVAVYEYGTHYVYKKPHTSYFFVCMTILKDFPPLILQPLKLHRWRRIVQQRQLASLRVIANYIHLSKYLAHPVIESSGAYYQSRAIPVYRYVENLSKEKFEELVDDYARLTYYLYEQGFIDKSFNFLKNFGILDGEVVLTDLGELFFGEQEIREQLEKRPWAHIKFILALSKEQRRYLVKVMDETFLSEKNNT